MGGIGIRIDATEAQAKLKRMIEAAANPRPLLRKIGRHGVRKAKALIRKGIPPPTHPYFAELKRRSHLMAEPLHAHGHLYGSITHEVAGLGVRVGSPLRYAATHQFGSDGPRRFPLFIIPDLDSEGQPERNEYGLLLGALTTEDDPKAEKQFITITVRKRPFLKPPTDSEWAEMTELIEQHLTGGKAA
jgi:phage gpG-like protein